MTIERTASNGKALVSVQNQSTVTMKGSSKIDGKKGSFTGRGVEVQGTFNLNGGTIVDNKGAGKSEMVTANVTDGCGVYVVAGGTFTMSGGTIEGNETTSAGAAVAVNGDGATFNLENDGTIQNNTAAFGAVMARKGTFEMTGGTITANTAITSGGGVAVSTGTFTMSGGTISGNEAKSGGGVFMNNGGKITLNTNSIITENTATSSYGGGVDVNHANAIFILDGGTISSNSANSGGGGVSLRACKSTTMNDGTIENNKGYTTAEIPGSGSLGGGIYLNYGLTFEMNGGIITGNSARNGGGICLQANSTNPATVKYAGGEIQGNNAVNGNGIRCTTLNQGIIIYLNNTTAANIADGVTNMTVGSEN